MKGNRLCMFAALVAACSNSPDARLIAGGGIGDGDIDGTLHVFVIDHDAETPVSGAMVQVGTKTATTDSKGLVSFEVSGAQTITVSATGYRGTVWENADGANVTIPVQSTALPEQATLTGTVTGYDTFTVAPPHVKAAFITYSQSDKLGDAENNLSTPGNGNICLAGTACNWTLVSRAGTVTIIAAILDIDPKGTADPSDDVRTVIGYAYKSGLTVNNGVNQSGLQLDLIQAGNLQNVTFDLGTPPAGLTQTTPVVGIEISSDEVIQLGVATAGATSLTVPNPTVFSATGTYRFSAIAQTPQAAMGAQSVVLRQGLTGTSFSAGTWLEPPTNVTASRTNATFDRVAMAKAHSVQWADASGNIVLEITNFDPSKTSVDVPALVALPTSGALNAKVQGIGADFDVRNFSLDADKKKLWGISAQTYAVQ